VKYSPDILHNNKGFIKKIENVLKENGKIKKTLLKKTMGYVLKRNNIGLLDGKKMDGIYFKIRRYFVSEMSFNQKK